MSTHGGDIYFGVKLDEKEYNQGLNTLERKSDSVGSNIGGRIGKGIGKAIGASLAGALATVGATIGISRLATKASELGDEIDKMSQKMGMSAKAYQEWSYVMDLAGTSIESLQMGIKTLATSAITSKDALKELGITEQDVANLSQEDLFKRVITGLQGVENTTRRTYLAGQLLGRGATELAPLLNMTAQETENLMQKAHALGGVMSDRAVKNSAEFKDALTSLKLSFMGVSNALAETLLPVLTNALNNYIIPAITRAVAWIKAFIEALGALISRINNNPIAKGCKAIKSAVDNAFGKKSQKEMMGAGEALGGVGENTADVGKNAKKAKKEVQALKRELLGFDRITKLTKQDTNTNTTGDTGTSAEPVTVGNLDYSAPLSDANNFADLVNKALGRIKIPEKLQKALDKLGVAFGDLWDTVGSGGKWALDNILKPLGEWTMKELAPRQVEALAEAIKVFDNVLELLGTILKPLWEPILKPFFNFIGKINVTPIEQFTTALKITNKVLEFFKRAVESAYKGIEKLWKWVKKFGKKVLSISLKDTFSKAWDKVKEKWDSVKNRKRTTTIGLKDKFSKAWDKVRGTWNKLKSKTAKVTLKMAYSAFNKGWKKIKSAWNTLKDKTANVKVGFVDSIKNGWNALAKTVNNARNKSDFAKKVLPSMPYLAQGAYLKANTPQLAVVGDNKREGEIVAPESKLRAMAEEVANNSANAQVVSLLNAILVAIQSQDNSVYLDGKELTRSVVGNINNATRRTGTSPILL